MKNRYYYKIGENNEPVPGTLQAYPKRPKDGKWILLGGPLCCSEMNRTAAVVSGNISTADQAVITLGCVGSPKATVTVPLTAGNSVAVKQLAVKAAVEQAFGSMTEVTSSSDNVNIYSRGIKCPDGVTFTIAYSVEPAE